MENTNETPKTISVRMVEYYNTMVVREAVEINVEDYPELNGMTEEDELADEDDELLNEVWRIHSGYDTREEAKAAATNLYDETGVDFKPASKEVVTRGLEVGIIIL